VPQSGDHPFALALALVLATPLVAWIPVRDRNRLSQ